MAPALAFSILASGCASHGHPAALSKAGDPDVIRTVTGQVVSIEAKKRSALTITNVAASNVASARAGSTLGLVAIAVDVLDHQAAKGSDTVYEVTLIDEKSGQDETMIMDLPNLTNFVKVGERVRLIHKKYGAESSHNLTRFPHKEELTR